MEQKFRVGQWVIITPDLKRGGGIPGVVDSMLKYAGGVTKIAKKSEVGNSYLLDIDKSNYHWREDLLRKV